MIYDRHTDTFTPFTPDQKTEIALFMIQRWAQWAWSGDPEPLPAEALFSGRLLAKIEQLAQTAQDVSQYANRGRLAA